jgi:hypothetical protein
VRSRTSVVRDGGVIVPVDFGSGRLHRPRALSRSERRAAVGDIVSLFFPDVLSGGPEGATKHSGSAFPDVQRVLGDQATVDLRDDGGLTFGQLPLLALSLVLLSSLLLLGALLPPGVIAHTPLSVAYFARIRQPLAVAAIAILLPVAVGSLAAALT